MLLQKLSDTWSEYEELMAYFIRSFELLETQLQIRLYKLWWPIARNKAVKSNKIGNREILRWQDQFIRVNHKTFVPVEVAKDWNGQMINIPIIPTEKPKISLRSEIRTTSESDIEDHDQKSTFNSITEV